MSSWFKAKLGRMRVSTVVLLVVFVALLWVHQEYQPSRAANQVPATQVVPPGYVPDPAYTWVPRTNVQEPEAPTTTTPTTTSPTTTTPTTSPGETTSPTSPTESTSPTDLPTDLVPSPTTATTTPAGPGPEPTTPAPSR